MEKHLVVQCVLTRKLWVAGSSTSVRELNRPQKKIVQDLRNKRGRGWKYDAIRSYFKQWGWDQCRVAYAE